METGPIEGTIDGEEDIPILPTRHGNSTTIGLTYPYCLNSDPTYEAWKLEKESGRIESGSYSDPTYEAWKHIYVDFDYVSQRLIPILPTRHGNYFIPKWRVHDSVIPILPTRHGNHSQLDRGNHDKRIPILPTRHGN